MAKAAKNYKRMSEELAGIIAWFESGEIDLDAASAKYEEALKLLGQMETYLKTAENKIHKISIGSKD
jgi:exodeoxyribonuclease VII small subunit